MAESKSDSSKPRSPFAGCTIVLVAVAVMVFLIAFVIWNLFKLDSEISKFTTNQPAPMPAIDLVEQAAAFNKFKAKLEIFRDAQGREELASLKLSPEDLNLAIAALDEFEDLRGTFSVTDIEDGNLHIAIAFPLRGKPMSGELRYLNGTMVAVPELAGGEIILNIEKILVPDKTVPDGFIGQMSPYRVTQRYLEDEKLGPWMKRLTNVTVQGDLLVLTADPAKAKERAKPKNLGPSIKRAVFLFGGVVILFIVLVAFLIALSQRRKAAGTDGGASR